MPHHGGHHGGHGGHRGGRGWGGGFWGPGVYLGPTYEIDEDLLLQPVTVQETIEIDEPQLVRSAGMFDTALEKAGAVARGAAADRVFPFAIGAGLLAVGACFLLTKPR